MDLQVPGVAYSNSCFFCHSGYKELKIPTDRPRRHGKDIKKGPRQACLKPEKKQDWFWQSTGLLSAESLNYIILFETMTSL